MNPPKFYTDVHISHKVVHQLQRKGVDILHCGDVGLSDVDDDQHLLYATQTGRVLVSCDQGFEKMHMTWQDEGKKHAGIVYFRMEDQCKSISTVVREILFLHEAAQYETDLYNQIWRVLG